MPWTNYHSHTNYCDGYNKPEEYAKEAVKQGMIAYGYSSHAPVPFLCEWTIPERKIGSYINEINLLKAKYKDEIQLYMGLEVDFIPNVTGPNYPQILKLNPDYTIGSIHFVDQFDNGERWCIDWTEDYFYKGLKQIFYNDVKKTVKRFFELNKQMVCESAPDVIGHLDKIRMHNRDLFDENNKWYKDEVYDLLKLIKSKNVIIEINTRGYYKAGSRLYPDPFFFKDIKRLNIPVSLNSDAHSPDEITKGYLYAAKILKQEGIDEIWSFIDNKWKPFLFDSVKGINL